MAENPIRHLRILWRAESIIADIHLRLLLSRSRLLSLAGLIAVFGLVMLNVAGFLALGQVWGQVWAAVAMGVIDLFICAVLVLVAMRARPGRELDLAHEVRDMALDRLEGDVADLSRFVKHPLDAALPALIGPLTSIVVKSLKKRREET